MNHWPAFVDVLTTVIMVVTFLLVIMSAAVMVLSQRALEKFKANYEATHSKDADPAAAPVRTVAMRDGGRAGGPGDQLNPIRSPHDAAAGTSVAQLGSIVKMDAPIAGDERLSIRTRDTADTLKLAVKADEKADDTRGVTVQTAAVLLRLDFDATAVNVDADAQKKAGDFLATRQQPGATYEIWSSVPQTASVSEAQRLAFYRAAMVRNLLIRAGIAGTAIHTQIRVTDPSAKDGHNVRVVVKP